MDARKSGTVKKKNDDDRRRRRRRALSLRLWDKKQKKRKKKRGASSGFGGSDNASISRASWSRGRRLDREVREDKLCANPGPGPIA